MAKLLSSTKMVESLPHSKSKQLNESYLTINSEIVYAKNNIAFSINYIIAKYLPMHKSVSLF